jgi:hypothetical protein
LNADRAPQLKARRYIASRMKRRISSLYTVPVKLFTVPMAIATVALFDLDILRGKIALLPKLALLAITLAVWAFFFWYCKRLKFVSVDDHALYVSDWFHGTTIPLAQVEYVYESAFQALIFVGLRSPSRYGRRIVFMPIIPIPVIFSTHPIAEELRGLIQRASTNSVNAI